jgi:hypothetical protein
MKTDWTSFYLDAVLSNGWQSVQTLFQICAVVMSQAANDLDANA